MVLGMGIFKLGGRGGGAEGLILFWTIGLVFSRLSFLHSKIIIKIVS